MRQRNLRATAEQIRRKGTGGDDILAHINPMEAMQLARQYGGSINPHTGLPEFGWLSKVWKGVKKFVMPALTGGLTKNIASSGVNGIMGGALGGGGLGGALGGGLGGLGSLLAVAGLNGLGGGGLGGLFGGGGGGGLGGLLGGGGGGLSGLFSALGGGGGGGLGGALGGLGGAIGGGGGNGVFNPMNLLLAATALHQGKKAKHTAQYLQTPEEIGKRMRAIQAASWGPEDQPRKIKPLNRKYIQPPEGHNAGMGEHQYFDNVNPPVEYYAKGGSVHGASNGQYGGYSHGDGGGQEDNIPAKLPKKSYVMTAMEVALLGDGNSAKGAKVLRDFEKNFHKSGIVRYTEPPRGDTPNAMISNGEYTLSPHTVLGLGNGSEAKGVKVLNQARKNLRKQKGITKVLLPRSKSMSSYLNG